MHSWTWASSRSPSSSTTTASSLRSSSRLLLLPSLLSSLLFSSSFLIPSTQASAVQVTSSNLDATLSSNEVVFLNFYANWCRFSQMLNPIYDELADKVNKEFPTPGLVTIGKVDCDSENTVAAKFHVNKYPTLKMYRHGVMTKREYRGARQADAMVEFIRKQVTSSIQKLATPSDLYTLDGKKRYIVGHFDKEDSPTYTTFAKVASLLRDECNFVASVGGDDFKSERPSGDIVYYRPPQVLDDHEAKDVYYMGPWAGQHEALYAWANEKCVPLVREITFENAEELTDEGLPFLILFHDANDHQSVVQFEREVAKQLMHERSTINCLHADGAKFVHPLHHLGKTAADLPLLTIDSFRHMFLFPDIKELSTGGRLLQFVQDLHSGKLHQDFHNPPPATKPTPATTTTSTIALPSSLLHGYDGDGTGHQEKKDTPHLPKDISSSSSSAGSSQKQQTVAPTGKPGGAPSSPPESVFIHLGPSPKRYSFKEDL